MKRRAAVEYGPGPPMALGSSRSIAMAGFAIGLSAIALIFARRVAVAGVNPAVLPSNGVGFVLW